MQRRPAGPMLWMRPALAWLFDAGDEQVLRAAVRDSNALHLLRAELTAALEPADASRVPAGERGDNLIMALVALRLKFPRQEAEQKLERNLRLRDGG